MLHWLIQACCFYSSSILSIFICQRHVWRVSHRSTVMVLLLCLVTQSSLTLCDPMNCSSSVHRSLQAEILEWVAMPSSRGSSRPGIKPRSPTLQADSLPTEPAEKPKNTGVGSLLLLQWIFPTQELNRGLQHCRLILHQLSYQGSTFLTWGHNNAIMPSKKLAKSCICFY